MNTFDISSWFGDFYLLSTLLLTGELLACLFTGQPARRMALAWATTGGLAVLAMLCALPGWSSVHLLSPAPPDAEWTEQLSPVFDQAIQQTPQIVPPMNIDLSTAKRLEPNVPTQIATVDWGVMALYVLAAGSVIVVLCWHCEHGKCGGCARQPS